MTQMSFIAIKRARSPGEVKRPFRRGARTRRRVAISVLGICAFASASQLAASTRSRALEQQITDLYLAAMDAADCRAVIGPVLELSEYLGRGRAVWRVDASDELVQQIQSSTGDAAAKVGHFVVDRLLSIRRHRGECFAESPAAAEEVERLYQRTKHVDHSWCWNLDYGRSELSRFESNVTDYVPIQPPSRTTPTPGSPARPPAWIMIRAYSVEYPEVRFRRDVLRPTIADLARDRWIRLGMGREYCATDEGRAGDEETAVIQGAYRRAVDSENCAAVKGEMARIEEYLRSWYPVPEFLAGTVLYPRRIEDPEIRHLADDRLLRLGISKSRCFPRLDE